MEGGKNFDVVRGGKSHEGEGPAMEGVENLCDVREVVNLTVREGGKWKISNTPFIVSFYL